MFQTAVAESFYLFLTLILGTIITPRFNNQVVYRLVKCINLRRFFIELHGKMVPLILLLPANTTRISITLSCVILL